MVAYPTSKVETRIDDLLLLRCHESFACRSQPLAREKHIGYVVAREQLDDFSSFKRPVGFVSDGYGSVNISHVRHETGFSDSESL